MNESKRMLILLNPVSGGGRGNQLLENAISNPPILKALADLCRADGPASWPIVRTTADGEWKAEVEDYLKARSVQALLVIGGDGTLAEVATILHSLRAEVPIIPIPGGRGNDFVRGLSGYSAEDGEFWSWAERLKMSWKKKSLDLACANGKIFINMASIGYGGRVVENAQSRSAFWSKTAMVYQVEGALALFGSGGSRCEVKADGKTAYSGAFFGAFVGNGKSNGSGLYWTRNAVFDDGKIDGIVFRRPGLVAMGRTLVAVKERKAPLFNHTEFQGSELVFHFDQPTALELDGTFAGNALSYGFNCLPRALKTWALSATD